MMSAILRGSEEPTDVSAHIECKDFLFCAYNYTLVGKEAHYPVVKRHLPFPQEHRKAGGRKLGHLEWRLGFHEHREPPQRQVMPLTLSLS